MSRVLLIGLGADKPSTRLRITPLIAALTARGHAVTAISVPAGTMGRLRLLDSAARHDLVVLQKKLFPVAFVRLLIRANPRLLFDVDDAVMFHELERNEPVRGKFFARFAAIAGVSRGVITGNRFVAEHAAAARVGRSGVTVLPTPIDLDCLPTRPLAKASPAFVVGWLGTKSNLRQLTPLIDTFLAVQAAVPGFCLRVVADEAPQLPGVRVDFRRWEADRESADLHSFDAGIMPLEDTLWNRGKGGFKLLQYMAAGLPAVASPVGINADLIRHGENGLLANRPSEWRDAMLSLAVDPARRQQLGDGARQDVERDYALPVYLDRYLALIETCLP